MKKKVLFLVAAIVTLAIVVGMIVFLVLTKWKDDDASNTDLSLVGTWKVVCIEDDMDGSVTFISNEFAVFDEASMKYYRQGVEVESMASKYRIEEDGFVSFEDLNTGYFMAVKTENYFKFWESETRCRAFVKYPNADMSATSFSKEAITGRWNVSFHDKVTDLENEYWVFENGTIRQFVDGNETALSTTTYAWEENDLLSTPDWTTKKYVLNFLAEDKILVVATDTGAIVELNKA